MSGRNRTILTVLAIVVGLFVLAVLFPIERPPIEAGPVEVFEASVGGFHFPISNSLIVTWCYGPAHPRSPTLGTGAWSSCRRACRT